MATNDLGEPFEWYRLGMFVDPDTERKRPETVFDTIERGAYTITIYRRYEGFWAYRVEAVEDKYALIDLGYIGVDDARKKDACIALQSGNDRKYHEFLAQQDRNAGATLAAAIEWLIETRIARRTKLSTHNDTIR